MKLLMHTCCAPCSVGCIAALRQEGIEPTLYWYNPNIHPVTEYRARRTTLEEYAKSIDCRLILEHDYGLREFIKSLRGEFTFGKRCYTCYEMRLKKTRDYAMEHGFDAFTTTLLVSPYQNREAILSCGASLKSEGLTFMPYDFRPYFKDGQEKARALGMYMQKYCGCIFSEEERYSKQAQKALRELQKSDKLHE